jgi:D-amino peptidase
MKAYIMTDLEGVAGVLNSRDYIYWDSRYYEKAKSLLTAEVNAAITALTEEGVDDILVADGHGYGGINMTELNPAARYLRGFPDPWPFCLDSSFDVMLHVGQHAKAGTPKAHIAHTGSHNVIDYRINDISVGEFGQIAMCACELGVMPIFGSGDLAFTKEAEALIPGIETVWVKEGLKNGSGDECTTEEYEARNWEAIHFHPTVARNRIYDGVKRAIQRWKKDPQSFHPILLQPPYTAVCEYRPDAGKRAFTVTKQNNNSVIDLLNNK